MNDECAVSSFSSFALPVTIGTAQGLLLWWISGSLVDGTWPATHSAIYAMLLLLAVFLPPTIYLVLEWQHRIQTWLIIVLAAVLLLGAGAHHGLHVETVDLSTPYRSYFPFALLLATSVWLFHAIPFAQGWIARGRWQPDYRLLFVHTWQNALRLALAALFTVVFWLLLWLWIELFDMLRIHFPKVLFSQDSRFSLLVAAIVFATGFHLAGSADRLLTALRQQVLGLLKWLAFVATVILILFGGALLLRSPELMASHRHLISATWLLWLAVVTIYLYNTAYQDGKTPEPYPIPVGRLLRYANPLLILITGMAFYALLFRAGAYGLTVSRIWGLFVAVLTCAYAVGYSTSALRGTPWMYSMGPTNVAVALLLLIALPLMLSPVLPPERLAANSLARQLIEKPADVSSTNYMVLRFDTGVYGRQVLQELASTASEPLVRTTAKAALAVRSASDRYTFEQAKGDASSLAFRVFPTGSEVDEDLRAAIAASLPPYIAVRETSDLEVDASTDEATNRTNASGKIVRQRPCRKVSPCPVLFVDLSASPTSFQAVAFWEKQGHVYQKLSGHWRLIPSMQPISCRHCAQKLIDDLEAGRYSTKPAQWKDLQIGNSVIIVTERTAGNPP